MVRQKCSPSEWMYKVLKGIEPMVILFGWANALNMQQGSIS